MRPKLGAVPLLVAGFVALTTSPSRATTLALHIHSDKAMFQVIISPGLVGTDSFVLQLMTGEGTPLAAKQATLILRPPGQDVAVLEQKATPGQDGYWHVENVDLTPAGRWHMRIEAVTLFKTITLEDDFEVPAQ